MEFLIKAYCGIFGDQKPNYIMMLNYSGKFKGYNANARLSRNILEFKLSRQWETIDEEIQIGLIQSLLCRLHKKRCSTLNIDLYQSFLKNVHVSIKAEHEDEELKDSFDRVNDHFFSGMLGQTNLKWGHDSVRCFGSYEYGTDTITMNRILKGKGKLLDYVMYHEMLHKKHKFRGTSRRSLHHSKEFREAESLFPGKEILERELSLLGRSMRQKQKKTFFTKFF